MKMHSKKGFTIVELVIVIAVIAILATVLVPTFGDMIEKSKQTAIIEEAKNLYTDYVIQHASDDDFTDDVVIEIDDKYYAVKDGELKLDDDKKATEFASAEEAAALFLGDDDTYFVVMHDNKEIETIPTTSDDENEGGENAGDDQNNGNP